MLDTTNSVRSRRDEQREQTRADILDAAWALCREQGLAALSLRELARRVGLQAPSLYSYFASKDAIYDAMFRQGQEQMASTLTRFEEGPVDRAFVHGAARAFFEFCTSDPVRYQLLFQRTIPGFEPSAASYALAIDRMATLERLFVEAGITAPGAVDVWTALLTGLTDQQISNDPGGDRWARLLDDAVDMFLDRYLPARTTPRPRRKR